MCLTIEMLISTYSLVTYNMTMDTYIENTRLVKPKWVTVLEVLYCFQDITNAYKVAAKIHITYAQLSRIIADLQTAGLLKRGILDGRTKSITITETGNELIKNLLSISTLMRCRDNEARNKNKQEFCDNE